MRIASMTRLPSPVRTRSVAASKPLSRRAATTRVAKSRFCATSPASDGAPARTGSWAVEPSALSSVSILPSAWV